MNGTYTAQCNASVTNPLNKVGFLCIFLFNATYQYRNYYYKHKVVSLPDIFTMWILLPEHDVLDIATQSLTVADPQR